jgi:predicted DNA-binding protein
LGAAGKKDRIPSNDEYLLLIAYASLYHWKIIGTVINLQRGYWMLSRVYQTLKQVEQALEWVLKCQEITEENSAEMEDFDLAAELGKIIKDPEDQRGFMKDFNSGDWYELTRRK